MSSSKGSWNSEINGAPMEMTYNCGLKVYLKTSWTRKNLGRRYWACPKYGNFGYCGIFIWFDPNICERAKNIIPGLLEKSNKHQHQIEQYKLKNAEIEAQLLVAMNKVDDMNNALVVCKNKIEKLWMGRRNSEDGRPNSKDARRKSEMLGSVRISLCTNHEFNSKRKPMRSGAKGSFRRRVRARAASEYGDIGGDGKFSSIRSFGYTVVNNYSCSQVTDRVIFGSPDDDPPYLSAEQQNVELV
ncbi:GRF zinc finger containing protein [Striga asiatica]|uniref:GRF zinc finger containing protein n=1 Tax=Striga asiatica TaxID=4170 RepID=A0A5A7PK90_STRAF|nr:GRF zinc finger containing protein [Striga asiatica]